MLHLKAARHGQHSSEWRFDSTTLPERRAFRKFGAIETRFVVLIVGKRSGSMAPKFLKGNPSENLVRKNFPPPSPLSEHYFPESILLSSRRCLLSVFAMDNPTAKGGSIAPNFLKTDSSESLVLSNRASLSSLSENAAVR